MHVKKSMLLLNLNHARVFSDAGETMTSDERADSPKPIDTWLGLKATPVVLDSSMVRAWSSSLDGPCSGLRGGRARLARMSSRCRLPRSGCMVTQWPDQQTSPTSSPSSIAWFASDAAI